MRAIMLGWMPSVGSSRIKRQTTSSGRTSRLTSRRMSVSPYATDRFCTCSMALALLSQVHLDHLGVALHLAYRALGEHLALVQDRHPIGDLANKGHIVVN